MWRNNFNSSEPWKYDIDVFEGEFDELILFTKKQPEKWVVTFARAITYSEFANLNEKLG